MKTGIVVFPGSNCDRDVHHVLNDVVGINAEYVWHTEKSIEDYDALILPGGFSYAGDLTPVRQFAEADAAELEVAHVAMVAAAAPAANRAVR